MSEPAEWREPSIRINGMDLSVAEAMTVRVAVTTFAMQLQMEGLGNDEAGKEICAGYLRACKSILAKSSTKGD